MQASFKNCKDCFIDWGYKPSQIRLCLGDEKFLLEKRGVEGIKGFISEMVEIEKTQSYLWFSW